MNIEDVRDYALSMSEHVTENLFADRWLSWRIGGKWFLLTQLDAPQPRVTVKLDPEVSETLREHYEGVRPAYHMNKKTWTTIVLDGTVGAEELQELLKESRKLATK